MADAEDEIADRLIRAWHSTTPISALVHELGMPEKAIHTGWRQLKIQGRLPTSGRKVVSAGYYPPERDNSGEEGSAELLRRLEQHHGKKK